VNLRIFSMWVGYGLNLLERRKSIVIARRKR
jgi:hypothetical protein